MKVRPGRAFFAAIFVTLVTLVTLAMLAALLAPLAIVAAAEPHAGDRPRGAAPAHVHVRGSMQLDVHAARLGGKLALAGSTVLSDTRQPLGLASVSIWVDRASTGARVPIAGAGGAPESCSDETDRLPLRVDAVDRISVRTRDAAEGGRFCVKLALATDRYVVHLEAKSGDDHAAWVDPARLDLTVDMALPPVTLRFEPEQRVFSLDEPSTSLDVMASTENEGVVSVLAGLPVVLSNETGRTLATATTDAAGRARFAMASATLGACGPGELRATFEGNALAGPAALSAHVERRTHVELQAPGAPGGRLPAAFPEDGIHMQILAKARCSEHGCACTPTGSVETRLDDGTGRAAEWIVGAAGLESGQANVVMTFAAPALQSPAGSALVHVRYVPDAPWCLASADLGLEQPIRKGSWWARVALLVAAAAVLGWLALARFPRTPRPLPSAAKATRSSTRGRSYVEVVRADPLFRGWRGRVFDAHDGTPVTAARVSLERPGFEGTETLAQAAGDATGTFTLQLYDPRELRRNDVLVVTSPFHAPLRRTVPEVGELRVGLVLRKRALLETLVAWARRRGKPFDVPPDPTPAHVARMARERSDTGDRDVARWADAVEHAAFAGDIIDEAAHAEVERLAPMAANAGPSAGSAEPAGDVQGAADDKPQRS